MTKSELIDYFNSFENAVVLCPWENDSYSTVAKHKSNGKWFAVILKDKGIEVVNLKCETLQSDFLRKTYSGVYPAYHMNKIYWNSVRLQSDVPDNLLKSFVDLSYEITL